MALVSRPFGDIITFTRASVGTYFNASGVLQTAGVNAPRLDFDPVTRVARGLLVEESRTNSITNNTMAGAVAGTPGTNPNGWIVADSGNGLTKSVVGVGVEDGISYIDIRYVGTPTAGSGVFIPFSSANTIAASTGQDWVGSVYVTLVGGSLAGTTCTLSLLETNGSSGTQDDAVVITPVAEALSANRLVNAAVLGGVGTTNIQPRVRIGYTVGQAIDITLRVGMPQLERGAFATSVIPTTSAAVTRAADVASVNAASPWYNQTEGTLYVEGSVISNSGNRIFADVGSNGVFGSSAYIVQGPGGISLAPNAAPVSINSTVNTNALSSKNAIALQANNSVFSCNGAIGTVDTACNMPAAVTTLTLGGAPWAATAMLNGWLRRVQYFPRRLSNAELQALTA